MHLTASLPLSHAFLDYQVAPNSVIRIRFTIDVSYIGVLAGAGCPAEILFKRYVGDKDADTSVAR